MAQNYFLLLYIPHINNDLHYFHHLNDFWHIQVILYIFYWNPFITETQDQIYKTKLTLNIIPVEILESQTNIKMLLGISDLNE